MTANERMVLAVLGENGESAYTLAVRAWIVRLGQDSKRVEFSADADVDLFALSQRADDALAADDLDAYHTAAADDLAATLAATLVQYRAGEPTDLTVALVRYTRGLANVGAVIADRASRVAR